MAIAALHSHVNVKTVIVVDDDVDVFDPNDVLWALSTRVRWSADTVVVPGSSGNELDPSSDRGIVDKVIIDATLGTLGSSRSFAKIRYPEVRLDDYVVGTLGRD